MVMGELPSEADVVVIGGGPGGYAAAFRAAELGRRVTLVEADERLGGTCLHRGCIPSKALLELAEIATRAREAGDAGLAVPAVVYADPQIAWCGLSERAARERGQKVQVARARWSASGRALTMGADAGLTKLVLEPGSLRVLGLGVAGRGAEGMIAEGVLAIEMGATARDLALTIHAHPTLSETIGEAADLALAKGT
jgi:pyruvate/2-oxoglutarate dehydrogenase complex dihydrolipoamide dehydrogenase (E3) component